jgi:hypothetical protein
VRSFKRRGLARPRSADREFADASAFDDADRGGAGRGEIFDHCSRIRRSGTRPASDVRLPDDRRNAVVKLIHPKAMPVILTTDEKREVWLHAP